MNLDEINGLPAKRNYPDSPEMYGLNGYSYYYWPSLNFVFRAQWPNGQNHKFNPFNETVELTFKEFLETAKRCRDKHKLFPGVNYPGSTPKPVYYYLSDESELIETTEAKNPYYDKVTELYLPEFIDLCLERGERQDLTLW